MFKGKKQQQQQQENHLKMDMESTRLHKNIPILPASLFVLCYISYKTILLLFQCTEMQIYLPDQVQIVSHWGERSGCFQIKDLTIFCPWRPSQDAMKCTATSEIWKSVLWPCGQFCDGKRSFLPLLGEAIAGLTLEFFICMC